MAKRTTPGGPIYIDYYKDRKGDWRWTIKAATNGKKMATSGEGYRKRSECHRALQTIATYLPDVVG